MAHHTELTWLGAQRYLGTGTDNNAVTISSGEDIGTRPVDLLLLALASCAAYDVVAIVAKQRKVLRRLHVVTEGERATTQPARFVKIHLRFEIEAEGLTMAQAERAVTLSLENYCSVRASLDPAIELTTEVVLA